MSILSALSYGLFRKTPSAGILRDRSDEGEADEAGDFIQNLLEVGGSLDYRDIDPLLDSDTVEGHIITLVDSLKAAGLWEKIYWFAPLIGKTPPAHSLDLRRYEVTNFTGYENFSGWPIVWHGGVRHDPYGTEGNGTDAYGEGFFTPGAASLVNPALVAKSMFFYANRVQTLDATTRFEMGTRDDSSYCDATAVRSSGTQEMQQLMYASPGDSAPNTNRDGFFVFTEMDNPGETGGFRNGVQVSTGAVDGTQPFTSQWIMARQDGFGAAADFHNGGFGLFGMGDAIPDNKQTTFNTIIQTFMTSMSRSFAAVNNLFVLYGFTSTFNPTVTNPSASDTETFEIKDVNVTRSITARTLTEGTLSQSVYGSSGAVTSLAGKTYTVVDPVGDAYVDSNGVVKRVINTTAYVETDTDHISRIATCPLSLVGGVQTDVYNSYLADTAGFDLNDIFDAVITGFVVGDRPWFSTLNHGTFTYVWNASNPIIGGIGYYPTCISVYNSSAGGKKGGVLVTPRVVVFANHYNPGFSPSMGILFVTAGNVTVQRTIINGTQIGNSDIWLGLLDSDVPATITPAKIWPENFKEILPSLSGIQIPVFWSDQDKNFITSDLRLDAVVQPDYILPDATAPFFSTIYPTDSQRLVFSEALIEFDSGSPCLAMMPNGDFIAIGTALFGGAGSGPSIWNYRAEINAQIAAWGVAQTLTPTTELAAYDEYAPVDNYGYMSGNDFGDFIMTVTTTTGWFAYKTDGGATFIAPGDGTTTDTTLADSNISFWSCVSGVDSTPSGEITHLDVGGDDNLGGITKIDTSRLLSLVSLDVQQQGVPQTTTDILLPIDDGVLTTLNMLAASGLGFYEIKNQAFLTTVNIAGCSLTGFHITNCPLLATLNISSNSLSANSLNAIYTMLPDRTGLTAGSIVANTNTGYGASDTSIATAKNWVVS